MERLVCEVDEMMLALAAPPAHVALLTLIDLRRTVAVSSPRISPNGRRIAFVARHGDYDKDVMVSDLVVADVATKRHRTLIAHVEGLEGVEWSPDGTRLAYTARAQADPDDKSSKPQEQIFVLPMNGGAPVQLTHEAAGAGDFDWRPDGRAIAYAAHGQPSNEKAIKQHEDAFDVNDEAWTAQAAPQNDLLAQISAAGGRARRVGNGEWSVGGGFTYSRDGRSIFVTRITDHRDPNRFLSREIVRVEVASGKTVPIAMLSATQSDPLRARDSRIAFGAANRRGAMQEELALADANGMHARIITTRLDRNVGGAAFMPDDSLIVAANDGTQRRLFRVRPSGAVSRLPLGVLSATSSPSVSTSGTIAFTAASPYRPSELYVLPAHSNVPIRLTDYNAWIARYRLGVTHSIAWHTSDGLTADGVVTTPPGWRTDSRAPLVLYIHGGPTSASITAYSGFVQVLAAHGWIVFQPNYRGSDNLGLTYARTTVPHITSVPGDDIETGLARVLRAYAVQTSRIGVSGWSEGGLLTSWLITHDRRWRAAVSGAAVNDWTQYDAMSDSKDFAPLFIGASPWSSASQYALYASESPLTYASNVRTPTLIMSDAGDYRVPTPLAYEFYHEVRATGTPVQFVVYPVVGHFPTDPVRVEDILRRWEAWLARYL